MVTGGSVAPEEIARGAARLRCEIADTVSTVSDAISKSDTPRPDLVLMNADAPASGDTLESARKIGERLEVPVICLGRMADPFESSGPGCMIEPFKAGELRAVIERASARQRHGDSQVWHEVRPCHERRDFVLSTAPVIIYVATPQAGLTYLSDSVRTQLGYEPQELLGPSSLWTDLVHPEDRPAVVAEFLRAGDRDAHVIEYRVRHKRGSWRWFSSEFRVIRAPDGSQTELAGYAIDVTERHQAEQALRAQKELLQAIFDHVPVMLAFIGADDRIKFVNREWERVMGWKLEETVTVDFFSELYPDPAYRAEVIQFIRRAAGTWQDFRMRVRSGREVIASWANVLLPDGTSIGIGKDVTEHRQAVEKLRFQAHLLDTVGQAVIATDLGGRITYWNREAENLYGWPATEALGRSVMETTVPMVSREQAHEIMRQLRAGSTWSGEFTFHRRDGTTVPVLVTDSPIRDAQGELAGIVGISHDLTAVKQADEAVRSSRERLAFLVRATPAIIYTSKPPPTFETTFISENVARQTGYPPQEFIGDPHFWMRHIHPDDLPHVRADFGRMLEGDEVQTEYRFRFEDGSYRWMEDTARLVRDECGEPVEIVGYWQDVTARRQAEETLHELSARLLQAQDEERRRIARELHDSTAQELAAVAMNLVLLEQRLASGAPDGVARNLIADSMAIIEQSSRQVRTLSHLLHPPLLDELGLRGALRHYAAGFAERSGIQVELDMPETLGRLPASIETALFRIVQESLGNVHRHSGSETATVRLVQEGPLLVLEIRDRGRGLPPGVASECGKAPLGVGIGGMRERLRQLGGRLELESDASGTTVRASVPQPKPARGA